ncbi:uncharacterized protein LOC133202129 [Saccostrea echinata]|uniref:uncharacterized protein LOC133202129 n=1 Tax=Saccostrea echinata TaxID=191078 RepID=UPI002A805158|nr:uncharacterized protein LOC133202129 [Saccostrea echinata]XP_061193892.1 uncharacterized protein LOC133202129 [Saccostrea echinata]XP_061193893.1 uncharacterized protein LOC133202129 [Saccostrea echinata]
MELRKTVEPDLTEKSSFKVEDTEHENQYQRYQTRKRNRPIVACGLIMIGLTFIIWLVAMTTPGWLVVYIRNRLFPSGTSFTMSIFYYVTCESTRTCDLTALSWNSVDPNSYPSNKPSISEMQIVGTFAMILCGAVFVLELLNFRVFILHPSKTATSAILMLVAIIGESVLIGRMGHMVTQVKDRFKELHRSDIADLERIFREEDITEMVSFLVYRVEFPYSIFIASLGVLTGILAFVSVVIVFYRNRKSQLNDTVADNPCTFKSTS